MFQRIRTRRHGHIRSILAAATLLAASTLHAQPGAPEDHSSHFGGWTLNRELSSSPTSPDTPTTGDRGPGGGRGRGGVPGGGGGGGPRGGGGFGGAGGQAPLNAQETKTTMALIQELMTPTAHWVITSGEGGAITFTDSEGRSMRFDPNNKTEKHQLTAGTIETKTRWENEQLRQEIALSGGIKAVRTLAVLPENGQLIVTTTMEGGPGGRGGRRPPFRFVYLRDAEL